MPNINCTEVNHLGDPCRMKFNRYVGKHSTPMCKRHADKFDADTQRYMKLLVVSHEEGNHVNDDKSEGIVDEDGRLLFCSACRLEAEKREWLERVGDVALDDLWNAKDIWERCTKIVKKDAAARTKFAADVVNNPFYAIEWSEGFVEQVQIAVYAQRVLDRVGKELPTRYGQEPVVGTWNIITAMQAVREEATNEIMGTLSLSSGLFHRDVAIAKQSGAKKFVTSTYWS